MLQQLRYRRTIVDDVDRAAGAVRERHRRVDAHRAIERRENTRNGEAVVLRPFATRGAGADGLTHAQAAAGDHGRHDRRPVIAAGVRR